MNDEPTTQVEPETPTDAAIPAALRQFLADGNNTVSREKMLTRRFLNDLGLVAANTGYALSIFTPDVDREGMDVIIADGDTLIPIQLKSTINRIVPSSSIGNVHQSILKPTLAFAERLGFEPSPSGVGQQGAVVLIEIVDVHEQSLQVDVRYWVTSPFIIKALQNELIPGIPKNALRDVQTLLAAMRNGVSSDRVDVKASCFVPACSPTSLMVLLGLHVAKDSVLPWQYALQQWLTPPAETEFARQVVPGRDAKFLRDRHIQFNETAVRETFRRHAFDGAQSAAPDLDGHSPAMPSAPAPMSDMEEQGRHRALVEEYERWLRDRYGTIIINTRELASIMGFKSEDALKAQTYKKDFPIPMRKYPGRTGRYALTEDVAEWLVKVKSQAPTEAESAEVTVESNESEGGVASD